EKQFSRKWKIYDYELKTRLDQAVSVRAPAKISAEMAQRVRTQAQKIFGVLDCRDLGRIDFRLSDAGVPFFLEINALPSLEPGAGIYAAAALEGLHFDAVIGAVIDGAARRYKIKETTRSSRRPTRKGPLKVGFSFNVKR